MIIFHNMNIFLLISIPSILIWTILTNPEYRWTSFVPPIIIGLLTAILTCFIKEFFIFYSHISTSNFLAHFAYLSLRDSIIPVLVLNLAFFLLSKDDWDYKIESIAPLAHSFFAVYIPYFVLTGKEPQSLFLNIIKPLLFSALPISSSLLCSGLISCIRKKNSLSAAIIFAIIAVLLLPSLTESIWYYNMNSLIWIILTAVYIFAAVILTVLKKSRKEEI